MVVGGAGACGLTAALGAAEAGVDTLVLEREDRPAGTTAMSIGNICAADTRLQSEAGIEDSVQSFYEDILAKSEHATDPTAARTIAEEAGPTIDWLVSRHNIALELNRHWPGLGHSQLRLHQTPDSSGETLITSLLDAVDACGADVLTEAIVDGIYVEAVNASPATVVGVRVRRPDGTEESVGCRALVLATCGYASNPKLVTRHIPDMAGAYVYSHEGAEGHAVEFGTKMGAALDDLSAFQGLGTLAHPHAIIVPHTLLIEGGVLVNSRGERFVNELDNISGLGRDVMSQPEHSAWLIYTKASHEAALEHSPDYRSCCEAKAPRFAASVQELIRLTRISTEAWEQTLDTIGNAVDPARPDRFGRSFDNANALHGALYAIKVTGALFHTQGGLCVNHEARVISQDGTPFPNLFAGGGAARSVSGPTDRGYLPAMGLCTAVTYGRLAGQTAARQIRESQSSGLV